MHLSNFLYLCIKSSKVSLLICLFFFAAAFIYISELHAHGVVLDSMGVTLSGRGGANISHSDNGTLIHDNAAALVNMPQGKLLDITLEFLYPDIDYDDVFGSGHSKHEVFILPSFSLVYKKSEESRFAFGVGAFTSAGFGFTYTPGAQFKITDNTVIGMSYVSESRPTLKGDAGLSLPDSSPLSALFSNKQAEYGLICCF